MTDPLLYVSLWARRVHGSRGQRKRRMVQNRASGVSILLGNLAAIQNRHSRNFERRLISAKSPREHLLDWKRDSGVASGVGLVPQ